MRKVMLGYKCFRSLILMALSGAAMLVLLNTGTARANDIVVCKESDPESPVPVTGTFDFTIDGTPFSLAVGGDCASFPGIGDGPHTVTETLKTGIFVSKIIVDPIARLVSRNLANGTVTANAVDSSTATTITFSNSTEPAPPPEGICHNIGGPRDLGANCDPGTTGTCTVVLEGGGTLVVGPTQFLGIIVPFNTTSGGALLAHLNHGDGEIVETFDPPLHLASTGQNHKASNVECLGIRLVPQPPDHGN